MRSEYSNTLKPIDPSSKGTRKLHYNYGKTYKKPINFPQEEELQKEESFPNTKATSTEVLVPSIHINSPFLQPINNSYTYSSINSEFMKSDPKPNISFSMEQTSFYNSDHNSAERYQQNFLYDKSHNGIHHPSSFSNDTSAKRVSPSPAKSPYSKLYSSNQPNLMYTLNTTREPNIQKNVPYESSLKNYERDSSAIKEEETLSLRNRPYSSFNHDNHGINLTYEEKKKESMFEQHRKPPRNNEAQGNAKPMEKRLLEFKKYERLPTYRSRTMNAIDDSSRMKIETAKSQYMQLLKREEAEAQKELENAMRLQKWENEARKEKMENQNFSNEDDEFEAFKRKLNIRQQEARLALNISKKPMVTCSKCKRSHMCKKH